MSRRIPVAVTAALFAFLGVFRLYDYDLGLARATGRWIVENRDVPRSNVFSHVHRDRPFVDDKWAFHVLAHLVVDQLGPNAAIALRCLLLAVLGGLVAAASAAGLTAVPLGVLAAWTAQERFAFRPELFTLLFLALFVRIALRERPWTRRSLLALLAVQILWTNLHGYWVLGPIVAAGAVAGRMLERRACPREVLVPLGLAAAALVNPYGWALVASPVHILADLRAHFAIYSDAIVEFTPTFGAYDVLPSDLWAYRALLAVAALLLIAVRRRARATEVVLLLGLFVMSLELRRNVALFAIGGAPILLAWCDRLPLLGHTWIRRGLKAAGALACCAAVFLHCTDRLSVHDRLDKRFGLGFTRVAWPEAAMDYVVERAEPGVVFVSFLFASTFTGRAFPRHTPLIDGNTAGYDVSHLAFYRDVVRGRVPPDLVRRRYGIDWWIVRPGHAVTKTLIESPDWVLRFADARAAVFAHRTVADDGDLAASLASGADLPAGRTAPSTPWAHRIPWPEWSRGRLRLAAGAPARAEEAFDEAIAVSPFLYESWHERGLARLALGRLDEALSDFDRAHTLAPRAADVLADRALVFWRSRRFGRAERDLEAAIRLRPQRALYWFRLALVARDAGRIEQAIERARRAVELDPGFAKARELLVRLGASAPRGR